jgi:hypothetical protein
MPILAHEVPAGQEVVSGGKVFPDTADSGGGDDEALLPLGGVGVDGLA